MAHETRAHAVLSASGAHRWMIHCPGSARLEERLKGVLGEKSSPFAAEGTKAHELSELKLLREKHRLGEDGGINDFNYKARREALGTIPTEMDNATDYYCGIVLEKYLTVKQVCPDALLLLEQKLDFSEWIPQGFGTGDALILADGLIEVIDLKYGKGVPVSAVDNPQARIYGLGAIQVFGPLYKLNTVRNTIIQPRLDSVTEETLSADELLRWADEILKPAAELAWRGGERLFNCGEHCRFCAAKAVCSARAQEAMKLYSFDLGESGLIPDESIPEILAVAEITEAWIKDIKAYALSQAMRGQQFAGWKLVRGKKPPRKWTNEEAATEQLIRAGYSEDTYLNKALKSVTQVEKAVGKSAFGAIFSELWTQEEGNLALVPSDDKRIEVSAAEADFSDMTNN